MAHGITRSIRRRVAAPSDPILRPAESTAGEQRLMLAVIEDSIRIVLGTRACNPPWWRDLEIAWLTSEDRTRPFAFASLCQMLGIDAARLRRRVLAACRSVGTAMVAVREIDLSAAAALSLGRVRRGVASVLTEPL